MQTLTHYLTRPWSELPLPGFVGGAGHKQGQGQGQGGGGMYHNAPGLLVDRRAGMAEAHMRAYSAPLVKRAVRDSALASSRSLVVKGLVKALARVAGVFVPRISGSGSARWGQ